MAISTEIQRLQSAKAALKTAIENKGVTVPADALLDDYAALVDAINNGLPIGYTRLEYLQSDGNQYINTNIVPTANTIISGSFKYTKFVTYGAILGNHVSESTNACRIILTNSSGSIYFNNNNRAGNATNINCAINTKHAFTLNSTKLILDGVGVNGSTTQGTANNTALALFANKVENPTLGKDVGCTIYGIKIQENNTLVRDFVPAIRLSDNELGMYDKVSGTFFTNAGTGTFSYGELA